MPGSRNPAGAAPNLIPEASPAASLDTLEVWLDSLVSLLKTDDGGGVEAFIDGDASWFLSSTVFGVEASVVEGTDHFRTVLGLGEGTAAASLAALASSACFFINASLSFTVIDLGSSPSSAMILSVKRR